MSAAHDDIRRPAWHAVSPDALEAVARVESTHAAATPEDALFPSGGPLDPSRRRFLQLLSASAAFAGLAGCRWPREEIVPFGKRPEGYQPGRIAQYASTLHVADVATPVLVSAYDGRPIKVDGNPDHPMSRGAADVFTQAAILEFYDPDRAREVTRFNAKRPIRSSWADFDTFAASHLAAAGRGEGVAVLCAEAPSPSLARLRARFNARFPEARWYTHDPLGRRNEVVALADAFQGGSLLLPLVEKARVLVDLDADLLAGHPAHVSNARGFAQGRRPEADSFNRLYSFETTFSVTGVAADHRVPVCMRDLSTVVALLAAELATAHHLPHAEALGNPAELRARAEEALHRLPSDERDRLQRVVRAASQDLAAHAGAGLIAIGARHPQALHAAVAQINVACGNLDSTLHLLQLPETAGTVGDGGLDELASQMNLGTVSTLVLLGGNPVVDAAPELDFAQLLNGVPVSLHLSLHANETSVHCSWHLPQAHDLETWGDGRALDASLCVTQPLVQPLHGGRSILEVMALLCGDTQRDAHGIVRDTFHVLRGGRGAAPQDDAAFERAWREHLHNGFSLADAHGTPYAARHAVRPVLRTSRSLADRLRPLVSTAAPLAADNLELHLQPDARVLDGRYANVAWLQELPDPVTKLTWGNAAIVSPQLAQALHLKHGDVVSLQRGDATVEVPAYVLPGQAAWSVSLALGYGRRRAGRVGDGVGVDASVLRAVSAPWGGNGVQLRRTGRNETLACTQDHFQIDTRGREEARSRSQALTREGTLATYREHPEFAQHLGPHHPPLRSMWTERGYDGHRWGMAVDLNACIGCNACVVACQAENNITVVGKEQVINGREMQWMRIDRYFQGDAEEPQVAVQPMACTHCEMAPCEQVCPVGATMHSDEGLNVMAYNRCVGTRYCSNNCPYKVRRFNFFDYQKNITETHKLGVNPEVSIRSRGVMEKCTYCVQRIEHARIRNKVAGRPIQDGDIVPACQQTCPTQAIVFGDLNDADSRVAAWQDDPRAYTALAELNLKPRTAYLARLRNPHPDLLPEHPGGSHGAPEHDTGGGHG
jgi:molybdopterin-containing oxidoreductase family iron-sulfur binding subunit